jgi:ankyrin repeat protein
VSSERVARECGVQIALVNALCDYGANPDAAVGSALGHGEFAGVNALIARGARVDLRVAAATGRLEEARTTATTASAEDRHFGFAWATQFGHAAIVKLLLDLGEDPNRFNPQGAHSHSTPLHQAAFAVLTIPSGCWSSMAPDWTSRTSSGRARPQTGPTTAGIRPSRPVSESQRSPERRDHRAAEGDAAAISFVDY